LEAKIKKKPIRTVFRFNQTFLSGLNYFHGVDESFHSQRCADISSILDKQKTSASIKAHVSDHPHSAKWSNVSKLNSRGCI